MGFCGVVIVPSPKAQTGEAQASHAMLLHQPHGALQQGGHVLCSTIATRCCNQPHHPWPPRVQYLAGLADLDAAPFLCNCLSTPVEDEWQGLDVQALVQLLAALIAQLSKEHLISIRTFAERLHDTTTWQYSSLAQCTASFPFDNARWGVIAAPIYITSCLT